MARWRLISAHYIHCLMYGQQAEWEHKETESRTGRQARKLYTVPRYLDPNDPADQNYKETGEIIVSHEKGALPKDYILTGPPTPNMEPLDAEAEAISNEMKSKWINPIETLPGQGMNDNILQVLTQQLEGILAKQPTVPAASGVSRTEFEELQKQLAALMAQNAELQAAQPKSVRR